MAIGLLIDEGKLSLDENIYNIFPGKVNPLIKIFRPEITVRHLLTMTSGVTFNESGIVSGNDWLESYLNAPVTGKPGTEFQYNSLNTYVLSAIVSARTEMTLEEYLRPRLFEPLGITRHHKRRLGTFYLSGRHGKIRAALSKPRHVARKADYSGQLDPRIDHKTG